MAMVLGLPVTAIGQERVGYDPVLIVVPTASEVRKVPIDLRPAEEIVEPPLTPFYKNPWFWIAIAVTSCAAGVSIYMVSQQDPSASLSLAE